MQIQADFECGNILVQRINGSEAELLIRNDSHARFYQWFYFQVAAEPGEMQTLRLTNASSASYPQAWQGYRALASADNENWFRVHTQYNQTELIIKHRPHTAVTWYAFFVPYTQAMRENLVAECATQADHRRLLTTPGGRPVDLLIFGDKQPRKKAWIISRLHAGESMAEYAIDALMRTLLNRETPAARELLDSGVAFYCIPNMNPDGSALGNLRANGAGVDLNRVWLNPPDHAPEVKVVRELMEREGVDCFIDIHGDEERPYIWLVQPHPLNIDPSVAQLQLDFEAAVRQQWVEYGERPPETPELNRPDSGMSVDYVAARFRCPAFIIELPFKDTVGQQGEYDSLQPIGCQRFGRDLLDWMSFLRAR